MSMFLIKTVKREIECSQVKSWFVFEFPRGPLSRSVSQVVAIETETISPEVKGEH